MLDYQYPGACFKLSYFFLNTRERDAVSVDISCFLDYIQELALSCLIILNTSERDAVSVDISCFLDYIQELALSCLIFLK